MAAEAAATGPQEPQEDDSLGIGARSRHIAELARHLHQYAMHSEERDRLVEGPDFQQVSSEESRHRLGVSAGRQIQPY